MKAAIIAMAYSALMFILSGLFMIGAAFWTGQFGWFPLGVFSTLCGGAVMYVAQGMDKRRKWAWYAALVLCCLYLPSVMFLPMGVIGLCGLLTAQARREFGFTTGL